MALLWETLSAPKGEKAGVEDRSKKSNKATGLPSLSTGPKVTQRVRN